MIEAFSCIRVNFVFIFRTYNPRFALDVSPISILPIVILGLLNTRIGCYFYFSSIGNLPVQSVAIYGYLEPLSPVLFSVFLLKETLLPMQIIDAVLILGGAIFGELFEATRKSN